MISKILHKTVNCFILLAIFTTKVFFIFSKNHVLPKIFFLSLTKSQLQTNGKMTDFHDFLREERFEFNLNSDSVLLEVKHFFLGNFNYGHNRLVVTRDLYIYLVLRHIQFKNFIELYRELNLRLSSCNRISFSLKSYKKNIFDLSVWSLISRSITKETFLVTTQSHLINLPLVFKSNYNKIRKIMMWYSTNSVPLSRIGELKSNKWLNKEIVECIDQHFVWNSAQALDLETQGIKNNKIVGSILFYPKEFSVVKEKCVTFFDVTPLSDADTIYTNNSCLAALRDITDSIIELNEKYCTQITLRVKPKRSYSKFHSGNYISTLEELRNAGKLQILDWNENLYKCVSSSMAILSVPYSSPIEIGVEMNVPGAYYFEVDTEWVLNLANKTSPLFVKKSELKTWLEANVYFEKPDMN